LASLKGNAQRFTKSRFLKSHLIWDPDNQNDKKREPVYLCTNDCGWLKKVWSVPWACGNVLHDEAKTSCRHKLYRPSRHNAQLPQGTPGSIATLSPFRPQVSKDDTRQGHTNAEVLDLRPQCDYHSRGLMTKDDRLPNFKGTIPAMRVVMDFSFVKLRKEEGALRGYDHFHRDLLRESVLGLGQALEIA